MGAELHRTTRFELLCARAVAENVDLLVRISKRRIVALAAPLFAWLNAHAEAAVTETATTANNAITANRSCVDPSAQAGVIIAEALTAPRYPAGVG